jgi:hypothetical protein
MLAFEELDIEILFEEHDFAKNIFVTIINADIKYGFIANDFNHCDYYWNSMDTFIFIY